MTRYGVNFFPTLTPAMAQPGAWYDDCIYLARLADELGFNALRTVEHHGRSYGGYSPNPILLLTAFARATRRIRIQTGAVVPAFHNPTRLAEDLSMLDHLSHGRLEVGFARGFLHSEFALFGVPMRESRDRFVAGIEEVRQWWGRADMVLTPLQQPHPPVWVAANSTPESFRYAGREGYFLMIVAHAGSEFNALAELVGEYRESWARSGHPLGDERIQLGLHLVLDQDHRRALHIAEKAFNDYNAHMVAALQGLTCDTADSYRGYGDLAMAIERSTFVRAHKSNTYLAGCVTHVGMQMDAIQSELGEVDFSFQVNPAGMSRDLAEQSLILLADHVLR